MNRYEAVAAGALAAMRAHKQTWRQVDEADWDAAVQIASGKGLPPDPDCCVRGAACFLQRWVVVADCKLGGHQAGFFFFPPGSEPALPCPFTGKSHLYLYVRPDQQQELSYLFNSLSPIVLIRTKTESGAAHYTATLPAPRGSTTNQLTAQSAAQLPAAEPLAAATGAFGGRPSSPNDLYCDRRAGGSGGLVLPYRSSRGSSQLEARLPGNPSLRMFVSLLLAGGSRRFSDPTTKCLPRRAFISMCTANPFHWAQLVLKSEVKQARMLLLAAAARLYQPSTR